MNCPNCTIQMRDLSVTQVSIWHCDKCENKPKLNYKPIELPIDFGPSPWVTVSENGMLFPWDGTVPEMLEPFSEESINDRLSEILVNYQAESVVNMFAKLIDAVSAELAAIHKQSKRS